MVMDDQGNLFVTGRARPSGGYNDFATIKYNSDGEQQWASYYDGPNNLDDDPIGIAVGENGNIYVCGESNRTGSNFEFIVVQYDAGGMFDWEFVHDADASSNARGVWMDPGGFSMQQGREKDREGTRTSWRSDFHLSIPLTMGMEKSFVPLSWNKTTPTLSIRSRTLDLR